MPDSAFHQIIVDRTLVLDGRNYLNRVKLEALGFRYIGVGK